MERHEQLVALVGYLAKENPAFARFLAIDRDQLSTYANSRLFQLFRSLANVRPPVAMEARFLAIQDAFLQSEIEKKGIVDIPAVTRMGIQGKDSRLLVYQGDITTLKVDAIVNAANSALLGCFSPCHGCIDNAIHTFCGVQLRLACQNLMEKQGHRERTGEAKLTPAFNLPSRYVIHTVGPIVQQEMTPTDERLLASCYRSCMLLAAKSRCSSLAFCCISTGEFHFPNQRAAEIALETIQSFFNDYPDSSIEKVVFNVFKDMDYEIYKELLAR
jgi:O-acetyl-ADP-ribose deacetylase (regulator of RNase III)